MLPALLLLAASTHAARQAPAARPAPEPRQQSAQEVAAALQKKYDAIRDFTADFVHESEGGVLRKKQTESGVVQVKKPGKMRWDYKKPEPKVFVSDGRRIYLHVPADNQVIVSPVPEGDQATTAVLFLVGKGNLTRDFTVKYMPGAAADAYALRLQPKLPDRDYDWLQIVVDRRTLQIRSLSAADSQGGRSTFQFSNLKENVGVSDKVFEFKIPRGADVTTNGEAAR
ncbi:MAG: outer rane lipoprotein carrier protein [Acidobacteriota bacterium]